MCFWNIREGNSTQGGERKIAQGFRTRIFLSRLFFQLCGILLTPVVVVDTQTSTWGGEHFRKAIESITDKPI